MDTEIGSEGAVVVSMLLILDGDGKKGGDEKFLSTILPPSPFSIIFRNA